MTGTQLRIGNILRLKSDHSHCQVRGVKTSFCIYVGDGKCAFEVGADRLEGLPLTNGILKACGFTDLRTLRLPGEDGVSLIGTNKNGGVVVAVDMLKTEFKFLHQLQNLFFGLTGQELKIDKLP